MLSNAFGAHTRCTKQRGKGFEGLAGECSQHDFGLVDVRFLDATEKRIHSVASPFEVLAVGRGDDRAGRMHGNARPGVRRPGRGDWGRAAAGGLRPADGRVEVDRRRARHRWNRLFESTCRATLQGCPGRSCAAAAGQRWASSCPALRVVRARQPPSSRTPRRTSASAAVASAFAFVAGLMASRALRSPRLPFRFQIDLPAFPPRDPS